MAQARLTAGQRQGVAALMGLLSRAALLELLSLAESKLAEIAEPEEPEEPGQEEAQRQGAQQQSGAKRKSLGAGVYEEIKLIHGRPYRYERWRDGAKLRSRYVGPASQ